MIVIVTLFKICNSSIII